MSGSLKNSLAQHNSRLKKDTTSLTDLCNDRPGNAEECQNSIDRIEILCKSIRDRFNTYEKIAKDWQDIVNRTKDAAAKQLEEMEAEKAFKGYCPLIANAEDALIEAELKIRQLQRILNPAPGKEQTQSKPTSKLPKLVLQHYDGEDPTKWTEFWSMFETSVHKQPLSGTEKFTYLKSLLDGKAKKSIEGITISDANYQVAVDGLKARFQRKAEEQITGLYAQLMQLPAASRKDHQRDTFDECQKILRQLENAGENLASNRSLVISVLSKFPGSTVAYLQQHYKCGVHSDLQTVRDTLQKYLAESEMLTETINTFRSFHPGGASSGSSGKSSDQPPKKPPPDSGGGRSGSGPPRQWGPSRGAYGGSGYGPQGGSRGPWNDRTTTMTSFDGQGPNWQTPPTPCRFCQGRHFNADCTKHRTAIERLNRLKSTNGCTTCFGIGHSPDRCFKTLKPCHFCMRAGRPPDQSHHASALCMIQFPSRSAGGQSGSSGKDRKTGDGSKGKSGKDGGSSDDTNMLNHGGKERSLLMTAVATLTNPDTGRQMKARIVFDSASHRSFVLDSTSDQLKLATKGEDDLHIAIFGTKNRLSVTSRAVEFGIQLHGGETKPIQAHTTSMITNSSLIPECLSKADKDFLNTMKYALADDFDSTDGTVQVLIGGDYFWEFITGAKMTMPSGLFMIPSTVGILLAGRYEIDGDDADSKDFSSFLCITQSTAQYPTELGLIASASGTEPKDRDMDEFLGLEGVGISDATDSSDDKKAQQIFDDTIRFDEAEGRYQMGWLWKDGMSEKLPSNYPLALGRFKSLDRRIQQAGNDDMLSAYQKTIEYQLDNGIIEKVPESEIRNPAGPMHYLPHHPVVKPGSATTKVRIVYDASSKVKRDSVSLNECLYRGPVILPDLCQILMRFRIHAIAIVADIEKAFLQLGLLPEHRDATRFLWFKDPSNRTIENNVATYRFCRVAFGVICSPFLLGATIRFHLEDSPSPTAKRIADDVYVDNVISGAETVNDAKTMYADSKQIFAGAGMNLQEWCSSSDPLMDSIPEKDRVANRKTKVLGRTWDSCNDTLQLSITNWPKYAGCKSKRQILCAIASLFDPLGFFQPAVLPAKRFLQQLWINNRDWDETLTAEEKAEWTTIHENISAILGHKVNRVVRNPSQIRLMIVAFCDASSIAYATSVFLIARDDKSGSANLVFSKSKLAPTKKAKLTIPRLELLGLTIGAKAARFVREAISDTGSEIEIHLFTDSEIAIHWVRSKKPLTVFVQNRVQQVRQLENFKLHHVRSEENPADIATRGQSGADLSTNALWWHGPSWVCKPDDEWPPEKFKYSPDDHQEPKHPPVYHTMLAGEASPPRLDNQESNNADGRLMGFDTASYSSFQKLIRHSAIMLKFLKWRIWDRLSDDTKRATSLGTTFRGVSDEASVTVDDLATVKKLWARSVQQKLCADIFEALSKKKKHRLVADLGLDCDSQGIIRSYSRYEHADLASAAKNPILLPSKSRFTTLLIEDAHRRMFHGGVASTLGEIRQEFWIHQGRLKVSVVLRRCLVCRKTKGPPFALPKMPPWPKERVEQSIPFQFTGLDYLGPINVRMGSETHKIWVCLFTCLSVRAVHLEWVLDCSAQEFLNCLIRFISRRGRPTQFICDNAAQFRVTKTVADRMWAQAVHSDTVQSYAAGRGIRWTFITELAPWQGGIYERLVGVVKSSMKAIVGRRLLSWSDFVTILAETESIVNSRPITYLYGDINSRTFTLRPIDFILDLSSNIGLPIESDERIFKKDLGDAGKRLAAYWFQKRKRIQDLWGIWYNEYLLSLRETGSAFHKGPRSEVKRHPKVDEIVLVRDQDVPRGAWKLARVSEVITSSDGKVRSAEVVMGSGVKLRRSVKHLYPLECHQFESEDPGAVAVDPAAEVPPDHTVGDPGGFDGFTDEDIQRTLRALQQFPDDNDVSIFTIDDATMCGNNGVAGSNIPRPQCHGTCRIPPGFHEIRRH